MRAFRTYRGRPRWWVHLAVALIVVLGLGFAMAAPATAQEPCGPTYTVQRGDTLYRIASRCDTTVADILAINPAITNRNRIHVNQVINIPQSGDTPAPPAPEPDAFIYIVRPGDWLLRIARRFDVSLSALLRANPQLRTPSRIYPGQRLVIPLQPDQPTASLAPPSGPAGTQARVEGSGFTPGAAVEVLLGQNVATATVVATVTATDAGVVSTRAAIPAEAVAGQRWIAVLRDTATGARATSNEFRVTGGNLFTRVNIYLIALEDAGRSGPEIGCNDSVVPVEIEIAPTIAPLTAAMEQLLALEETTYGQSGLHNALAPSDLTVAGINIADDGTATIALNGTLQLGGVCDNPRVEAQLRQTALQFTTVDEVAITINGTPLEEVLSLR